MNDDRMKELNIEIASLEDEIRNLSDTRKYESRNGKALGAILFVLFVVVIVISDAFGEWKLLFNIAGILLIAAFGVVRVRSFSRELKERKAKAAELEEKRQILIAERDVLLQKSRMEMNGHQNPQDEATLATLKRRLDDKKNGQEAEKEAEEERRRKKREEKMRRAHEWRDKLIATGSEYICDVWSQRCVQAWGHVETHAVELYRDRDGRFCLVSTEGFDMTPTEERTIIKMTEFYEIENAENMTPDEIRRRINELEQQ